MNNSALTDDRTKYPAEHFYVDAPSMLARIMLVNYQRVTDQFAACAYVVSLMCSVYNVNLTYQ